MKTFRDNGAIGALLDEYEKAILELQETISTISQKELTTIVDPETKDKDCRSIQTILTHVARAGYVYTVYLRKDKGEEIAFPKRESLETVEEYTEALKNMFSFNEQFFKDYPKYNLQQIKEEKKISTSWGQLFDGDQLMEHAIVHVLRHRRQIERFLIKLRK